MKLHELNIGKNTGRFVSYSLVITKNDGSVLISDEVARKELIARVGVDDKHIDSFSINYQEYLSLTVIPRELKDEDGSVLTVVDGESVHVAVSDIADMLFVFTYE